ncbi:MAG TPA: DegT/DnrJ/EryC1/StrS family aminotransferase [Clostridiales bacterium]|nr:DegT/DnrJ/EryC1/StrS family aminotransferase [Clostridiales bacterium]HQK74366.1 DegT/DnrJ/EryC1/StrS family aminotransferase [Clostridiales bacterium]
MCALLNKKIWLSSPHMSEEGFEFEYVREAFETNWIAPLGPNVDAFEKELAARVGVSHAAALVSGTAAIHLALKAAGVGPGDTVICQSLTFSASANPIVYQNAVPVFVDSDEKTWNMDPALLEEALKQYPAAKAVIVVNLYGLAADLDPIVRICKEHGVALIEDAAESLGTLYKGRYTGTFGDYGVYSFNGNKIITSSGGGMLVSENGAMIEKARFWATQARDKARHYQHSELGYNYRMSNVVAGIGRGQLKVLERRIARKKEIFSFYRRELEGLDGLSFMPVNDFNEPNYWLTCIQLKGSVRPLDVIEALEADNIESRPIWKPLHLQPFFAGCGCVGGDTARGIFENGLCLPSGTNLSDEDLERVARVMKKIWQAV